MPRPIQRFLDRRIGRAGGSRQLLARGGLNPDYPTPEGTTLLHALCSRDVRGRTMKHRTKCAAILLDAGARSTPLAWAARNNLPDMVESLLERGAPTSLPDDAAQGRVRVAFTDALRRCH